MYGIISRISILQGVKRLTETWNEDMQPALVFKKERVSASLRNHRELKTEFEQSNKTGWKTQCGLLAFRISHSLSWLRSLSHLFINLISYHSVILSPFPIGNCIKSRGSCQDLKPRPNYQLLLFERKEVNRCCWVDTASRVGGAPIAVPIGPSHFLCPESSPNSWTF